MREMSYYFFEKHKGSEEKGGALFRRVKEDKQPHSNV